MNMLQGLPTQRVSTRAQGLLLPSAWPLGGLSSNKQLYVKLGSGSIIQRHSSASTSLRHPAFKPAAAAGGDAQSSSSSTNAQRSSSWVPSLLSQPSISKLAQRIPQLIRAAQEQVLLFVIFGAAAAVALVLWAKGSSMYRNKPYSFHVRFSEAEGIDKGVPLRLKGVRVGEVQNVAVDMHTGVTAQVEVFMGQTLIPKHPQVKIEYNRTGMMSPEPFIDVTVPSRASPYALRTSSRKGVKAQQQQQQQQQDRRVDAADAAAAAVAASSVQSNGIASEDAQHGSEAGTEDVMAWDEGQAQRALRDGTVSGKARVSIAQPIREREGSVPGAAANASTDIVKGDFIKPGDVVEGRIGGSTDILTRMTVKSNRGPGKIQPQR